jgi:hypothetical protein
MFDVPESQASFNPAVRCGEALLRLDQPAPAGVIVEADRVLRAVHGPRRLSSQRSIVAATTL